MIAGGPSESAEKVYEIQNKVYIMKTNSNNHQKFKWKQLTPFPFKKKVSNIVYNGFGKFFCFVAENTSRELPQIVVYDVRKVFPQFDRYHKQQEEINDEMQGRQRVDGRDIRIITADH